MKTEERSIKKQILRAVLGCGLVTLIIASGITLLGMMRIKSKAAEIAMNIGGTAAEKSSEILKEEMLDNLRELVRERAKSIEHLLGMLTWDAEILSRGMTKILQNPQDYKPRRLYLPGEHADGEIIPQLRYIPGVRPEDVAEEAALSANLQDLQRLLVSVKDNYEVSSTYLVSANGFVIDVDRYADLRKSPFLDFDARERPYYMQAVRENKAVLTGIYIDRDVTRRGIVLTAAAPYFNADGEAAGVIGLDSGASGINAIVKNTKIGDNGYSFVLNNKTGQVLFSPKAYEGTLAVDMDFNLDNDPSIFDAEDEQLASTARKMSAGETGIALVNVDGIPYYLAYTPIEGIDWSLGSLIEEATVTIPAETSGHIIGDSTRQMIAVLNFTTGWIIKAIVMSFIVIMAVVPFFARIVAGKMIKPLHELAEGVKEITGGNLDKKLDVQTGDEIEHLAECFNAMTDELKIQMSDLEKATADKEKTATEISIAANIQFSMLSRDFNLGRNDVEIYSTMEAAREVGGDFYDFYMTDDRHLVVTIADVSGKGISAAFFMAISKTILYDVATMTDPDCLSTVMACANNRLCRHNREMMFVTVFMAMIDLETGKMIYVNGGHNPPLVYRHKEDQRFHYLDVEDNCVLGLMGDIEFVQQEIQLERGDVIYLYTDGVTEAMNEDLEQYNEQRLEECLNAADKKCDLRKLLAAVKKSLLEHTGDAEQSDDMTMMAVRLCL